MQKSLILFWLAVSTVVLYGLVKFLVPELDFQGSLMVGIAMLLTMVAPIVIINLNTNKLTRAGEETVIQLQATKRQLKHLEAKYAEVTTMDELTGCVNRRRFVEILIHHRAMSVRSDYEFTIAVTKIDEFDDIRDKHGADQGNEILQVFARIIKSALRDTDSVARLESDKFGLFLSACDEENALRILDRISSLIGQIHVSGGDDLTITASGGITCFHGEEEADEMIDHAEQALTFAIKQGRGSVVGYNYTAPDKPETSEEAST